MKLVLSDYIAIWGGRFFWCGKLVIFYCWVRLSPHLQGKPYRWGIGQSINVGGNKHDESRRNMFGKMSNTGGIIQGNNSGGHCFVLRDLIPMNFLK